MTHVVTAPYVTLRIQDEVAGKWVLVGFYKDAPVPSNVHPDDLARHVRKGMVAEVAAPEEKAEPEKAKPADAKPAPAKK